MMPAMSGPDIPRQVRQQRADIDELYVLVEGVDRKVDALAVNFTGRMDALDGRMDGLDGRMDGLDGRMDALDGRMDALDGQMSRLNDQVGAMSGQVAEVLRRLGG